MLILMLFPHHVVLFLSATFVLAAVPGPGMLYVAARTLAGGRLEGIVSSLGTAIGGLVHVAAAALGLSAIILASAELFTAVKVVGAIYLVWLGLKTLRLARREAAESFRQSQRVSATLGVALREGIIVEATNPKTAAFFLAFLPQFVSPGSGHLVLQLLVLGAVSVCMNTLGDLAAVLGAGAFRSLFQRNTGLMRRFRQTSGGILIGLGAGALLARRPS
jgi:threonine/homoserine/homoserine lactone efflux protein